MFSTDIYTVSINIHMLLLDGTIFRVRSCGEDRFIVKCSENEGSGKEIECIGTFVNVNKIELI